MRIKVEIELRRPSRRAAVFGLVLALLAVPGVVLAGHQFSDVPNGHPFHDPISAIAEAGITGGFSDGTYRPSDPVTRQAMAAFMHRGFGRAGLAVGGHPMSSPVGIGAGSVIGSYVPVRELTITVPGALNPLGPTQLVHLQGRVHFYTAMTAAKGCPCEFAALIRDMTTSVPAVEQMQTFESTSSSSFSRAFGVEALFAASPGSRTYQLEVRVNGRNDDTYPATFALSSFSSLSALTFPFGPTGSDSVSGAGAANESADDDQLPERRRE